MPASGERSTSRATPPAGGQLVLSLPLSADADDVSGLGNHGTLVGSAVILGGAFQVTGWKAHHVSHYFVRRRANVGKPQQETTCRRFPKAGVVCDCKSHLILSIIPGRGPAPDIPHFPPAFTGGDRNGVECALWWPSLDHDQPHRPSNRADGNCRLGLARMVRTRAQNSRRS